MAVTAVLSLMTGCLRLGPNAPSSLWTARTHDSSGQRCLKKPI